MTSEVAVLTKQAVVLAADSAVTSGGKIFNTVNKVFSLSKHQPVGIMAYSSAMVMGVPIETVIKEFRRALGRRKHDDLGGYVAEFVGFLQTNDVLFPEAARRRSLCALAESFVGTLHEQANQRLRERISRGQKFNKTSMKRALSDEVAESGKAVRSAPRLSLPGVTQIRSAVGAEVQQTVSGAIGDLADIWPMNQATRSKIARMAIDQFFRNIGFGGETGFVIAGFGEKNAFPKLRAFRFYCSALKLHKIGHFVGADEGDVTDDCEARILAFAQDDVVTTFMEGMAPVYRSFLAHFPGFFFGEKKKALLASNEPQAQEKAAVAESLGNDFGAVLSQEITKLRDERFVQPTMDVVAMMPKEELAALAEALVNVTALKRKASSSRETVGGPTDVAVISKGDGLVWVKRKHYFDPALNPTFITRYLEGPDGA
jgi:hypothetical protein